MLTELLIAGSVGGLVATFAQTEKSMQLEAQAMKKYAKAFSREQSAQKLISRKEAEADASISKLAKRKKAILETTIPVFLEMYKEIQQIEFTEGKGIKELNAIALPKESISGMHSMAIACSKPLTEKELVTTLLFKGVLLGGGIGGIMIEESKRELSAASSQLRASNVVYSQAETMASVLEAAKDRADRMADLLKRMNMMLILSIDKSKKVITQNGTDPNNYSEDDIHTLINCVNWLKATKDIIDTPLFNESGQLEEASTSAIAAGEEYISKINSVL